MDVDYKLIGNKIRRARKKHEKSQEWLAEKIGVTTPTISHIETGTTKVTLDNLIAIANLFKMTADEFVVDSLQYPKVVYKDDLQEVIESCSLIERVFLTQVLRTVKEQMTELLSAKEDEDQTCDERHKFSNC